MEHLDHVLPSSMSRIHSNLASVLSQVHASPESPAWAGYLRNVDHVITERLKDTVLTAVGSLLHRAHLYEQVSTQGPVCMKTSVHAVFAMPSVLKWLKHISTMYVHTRTYILYVICGPVMGFALLNYHLIYLSPSSVGRVYSSSDGGEAGVGGRGRDLLSSPRPSLLPPLNP